MKKRKERRKPVVCPYCQNEMVCMNLFESIYKLIRGLYVWYACPSRKGETGCRHSVLLEISPKSKKPYRIVTEVKFKKIKLKKKTKK